MTLKLRRKPIRRKVRLRGISDKRLVQIKEYSKKRREFLILHACKPCLDEGRNRQAIQVHHMRGRIGEKLLDERYWLPVCDDCHKFIHAHGRWAREQGYLV